MEKKSEASWTKRGSYLSSQSEQKKQLGGMGEHCKPSGTRDQAPENLEFSVSKTLNSTTSGNHFVDINWKEIHSQMD